jgi:hypothetical protein
LLLLVQIFNLSVISIAVLENVPPTQGYIKEPPFPHYLQGLAGAGDQTWTNSVAGSGASCSAIYYDLIAT